MVHRIAAGALLAAVLLAGGCSDEPAARESAADAIEAAEAPEATDTPAAAGADAGAAPPPAPPPSGAPLRIFLARRIVTMDPDQPRATAVAVHEGRIVKVGSLASIRAELADHDLETDASCADKVLIPGLIEPHLHPYIAALLLPMEFVTPYDWDLPTGRIEGVRTPEAYLERLRRLDRDLLSSDAWLETWGYHPLFHGEVGRAELDEISSTRPILVWHRSFHEILMNTRALEETGLAGGRAGEHPQVDLERGRFWENGLRPAFDALAPRLLDPERYRRGLELGRRAIHAGGITTVMDGAFGTFDLETEWEHVQAVWGRLDTPFRTFLLPDGKALGEQLGSHAEARARIETLPERGVGRVRFVERAVKLFADGAFYSQLMQMSEGYTDGHEGEWLMTPSELEAAAREYWGAGYQIHVHANGDLGVDAALDVLETLQREQPREDHRFALHHLGYSTDAQSERMAALGAVVSANPYYLWALGDVYAEHGLGPERAAQMVRLGSLARAGVRVSYHSDFTMAPARPLLLASIAATRTTARGTELAPEERVSLEQAMRAVTLDAAYVLRMEDEIGSIEVGKRADFTVLEEDPFEVGAEALRDVKVWGTVLGGEPHPVGRWH